MRRKRREAAGEAEGRNDPNCKASCFAGKQASISGNAVSPLGGDHAAAVPRCRRGQIIRPTLGIATETSVCRPGFRRGCA